MCERPAEYPAIRAGAQPAGPPGGLLDPQKERTGLLLAGDSISRPVSDCRSSSGAPAIRSPACLLTLQRSGQ